MSDTITMPDYSLVGIKTKHLGPTNARGTRVKATRTDHRSGDKTITLGWDYSLNVYGNHAAAARALAEYYEWAHDYAAASTDTGYVFAVVVDR